MQQEQRFRGNNRSNERCERLMVVVMVVVVVDNWLGGDFVCDPEYSRSNSAE